MIVTRTVTSLFWAQQICLGHSHRMVTRRLHAFVVVPKGSQRFPRFPKFPKVPNRFPKVPKVPKVPNRFPTGSHHVAAQPNRVAHIVIPHV